MLTEGWALGPPTRAGVDCAGSADTKSHVSQFPIVRVDKGDTISLASYFLLSSTQPLLPNLRPPPPVVMASDLLASHYRSKNDLRVLRKAIGWQSPGYDSKMQSGMLLLTHPGDLVYFSSHYQSENVVG
jgi:hypothetical protein